MFRTFATLLGLVLGCGGNALGDVLIYNGHLQAAGTGAGQTLSISADEYFLIDPDTRVSTSVEYRVENGRRLYAIRETKITELFLVRAADGNVFTVFTDSASEEVPSGAAGFLIVKGVNEQIAIGGGITRPVAPLMLGPFRAAGPTGGFVVAAAGTLNLKLNLNLTIGANDEAATQERALDLILQHLHRRGYQDETP